MDALCVSRQAVKLKRLLDSILTLNFRTNDTNFDLLISHISGGENTELSNALLSLDLFAEWIMQACTFWEENPDTHHPAANVGRFVLELTAIVSKNEERFSQLSSANAYLRLCDTLRVRKSDCVPSIKSAYVKLLEAFLEHKSGVSWIRATNAWIDVLNYCLSTNSTASMLKESNNFMYKLLESRVHCDEEFCNVVVKRIMQPLATNTLGPTTSEREELDENTLKTKLLPTLHLIISILEQYLRNEWSSKRYLHVPKAFFNNHGLQQVISTYMLLIKDQELTLKFCNIAYLIYFISTCIEAKAHMIMEHEAIPSLEKTFYLIEEAIAKKHCTNVLKLCYLAIDYWSLIHTRLLPMTHKDINKDPLLFQNQIVIMQFMPIFQFFEDYFKLDWNFDQMDDLREVYVNKCCRQLCQYTVRLVYNYRNAILVKLPCDYQIAMEALEYIIQSRKYYKPDAAVVIFQALIYFLHDIIAVVKMDGMQDELASNEHQFFCMLICALRDVIENFNMTWTKCVESIGVVNVVLDLLLFKDWPTKLTVEALKLLKLSIVKYMAPNLALLVDQTSDTSVEQLGPLLASKLKLDEWEIRNGCLDVLTTICELAHTKFSSFQDMLRRQNFPFLVVKLCLEDSERFVRAAALKCLQEMVQSPVLWDEFFEEQQLPEKALRILSNETEGVVRLEAAALIRRLHLHPGFEDEKLSEIYGTMAAAATVDLHWEVKKRALEFWEDVIWERLKNEGMIDGNFPDVTFSKEHRKIVVLNDGEIRRRLNKVLVELSANGCLKVLMTAIQNDCDIEVVEQAVNVTKKFEALLNKYKILSVATPPSSGSSGKIDCFNFEISPERQSVEDFLNFLRVDFEKTTTNRRKWLKNAGDSFGLLLDQMLRDYEEDKDTHTMHCH